MTLSLPKYTFLRGPNGAGKSTLAELLCDQDSDLMRVSFAEPIRNALLGTFYPDEIFGPSTIDLRDGETKKRPLPVQDARTKEANKTHPYIIRQWMIDFSLWMKFSHGEDVFGQLALNTCKRNEAFYSRFVFDDCRFKEEISPLIQDADPSLCLSITIQRADCVHDAGLDTKPLLGVRNLFIKNDGSPIQMLEALTSLLQPTKESTL